MSGIDALKWSLLSMLPLVGELMGPACRAEVVINEVMANALDERTGEFIELFNAGSEPVDVSQWRFTDGDAVDFIVPWDPEVNGSIEDLDAVVGTTIIPSGGYALVIDPEYASVDTGQIYNLPPGTVVLTVEDATLGNGLTTTDPVTLYDDGGTTQMNVVDTYGTPLASDDPRERDDDEQDGIPFNPGNGISAERVDPWGADEETNWQQSRNARGSTPGARNSVTRAPHDISVREDNISFDPPFPAPDDVISINVWAVNEGTNSTEPGVVHISFFDDLDKDSTADVGEAIALETISGPISPGDSAVARTTLEGAFSGIHLIIVEAIYSLDEDTTDNMAGRELSVSFPRSSVVLNEIMYDPRVGPEWVEIYNMGSDFIGLFGWTIEDSDSSSRAIISPHVEHIPPGGYVVVADDTADFSLAYPLASCSVFQPVGGFPLLNNAQDALVLRDATGQVIDSLWYFQEWGGDDGVSLERITPSLDSYDGSNWSSSVAHEGSTPCEGNSIYTEAVPSRASLSVSPNPFSPDADGHEDFAVISYDLPVTTALATIKVFDIKGRLIATIVDQEPTGSRGQIIWDGKDDDGTKLNMGIYIVYIEALNASQGVLSTLKGTVVVAGKL